MAKVKAKKEDVIEISSSEQLANKYRPRKLKDVVGQPQAVATIEGMFARKNFPAAMMISGHYGCGKTSLAYIVGRMVNCEKHTVCGKCLSCKFGKSHPDIMYHDCGTLGKIDDIRSLISASKASPMTRKRFMIVDEFHLLRDQSEKALLVETENPSPNTIWILCTSDPQKVSKTLTSRNGHIHIKPIAADVIVGKLLEISESEGVTIKKSGKKALETIAQSSDGSMRQAIAKLDMLLNILASGKKFDAEDAATFIDDVEADLDESAAGFLAAVMERNMKAAVLAIRVTNNARGLLNRTRWLVDYLIADATKTAKWAPNAAKIYQKMKIKTKFELLVVIQHLLCEIEVKFNSVTIDENVLFYSSVGAFILENE